MKVRTEKFVRSDSSRWWSGIADGLCDAVMGSYFAIPARCREIWVSLHTTPTPNRLEMTVEDQGDGIFDLIESVGGEFVEDGQAWGENTLDAFLEKYVGKTLYVQVEYMG